MDVRVDEPGEDVLALSVDHLGTGGGGDAGLDPSDGFVFTVDVGFIIVGHNQTMNIITNTYTLFHLIILKKPRR